MCVWFLPKRGNHEGPSPKTLKVKAPPASAWGKVVPPCCLRMGPSGQPAARVNTEAFSDGSSTAVWRCLRWKTPPEHSQGDTMKQYVVNMAAHASTLDVNGPFHLTGKREGVWDFARADHNISKRLRHPCSITPGMALRKRPVGTQPLADRRFKAVPSPSLRCAPLAPEPSAPTRVAASDGMAVREQGNRDVEWEVLALRMWGRPRMPSI